MHSKTSGISFIGKSHLELETLQQLLSLKSFCPKFSTKRQFLVSPLCGSQNSYRCSDSILSISLQRLLFTLAPNSYKVTVPLSIKAGAVLSVNGKGSKERRHTVISISLHSSRAISTAVLVKCWEGGKFSYLSY